VNPVPVQPVASVLLHERVDDSPIVIEVGSAESVAAGGESAAVVTCNTPVRGHVNDCRISEIAGIRKPLVQSGSEGCAINRSLGDQMKFLLVPKPVSSMCVMSPLYAESARSIVVNFAASVVVAISARTSKYRIS